jgi:hypothetical protein
MTRAAQLAIEVHYVPLPASELEERRSRLRLLLLRGAARWLREQEKLPRKPEPVDSNENKQAQNASAC